MGAAKGARADARAEEVGFLRDDAWLGTTPLTVLAGEPGSGRSTVLDRLAGELTGSATVVVLRLAELDRELPFGVVFRLLSALESSRSDDEPSAQPVLSLLSRVSAAPGWRPETAAMVATAVFPVLRARSPLVVLVDDAQWLDEGTAGLLGPLLRQCSEETRIGVVATLRLSAGADAPARAAFTRLRAEGRARLRLLRPLSLTQSRSLLAGLISARPSASLVGELYAAGRGNPAALTALVRGYRSAGAMRIVDRTAYRADWVDPPVATEAHPLLRVTTDAGDEDREVAEAMAVLAPLGESAAGLAAAALGRDETAVRASVEGLVTRRVLVRHRDGRLWFRVPAVRDGLLSRLGPYAWRNLAAHAVHAVWAGEVRVPDDDFLLDRVAQAGALVDARRAATELLAHGRRVLLTDGVKAERWLSAAVARVTTPAERAEALLLLSGARALHYRQAEAGDCARHVLRDHVAHLAPHQAQELSIVFITGLTARGEFGELAEIAAGASPVLPADPALMVVNQAFALMMSGRWIEACELLEQQREVWSGSNSVTADFAMMFLAGGRVVLGDSSQLFELVEHPERWRSGHLPNHWFEQRRFELDMLLQLGEYQHALRRMADAGLTVEQLSGPDRFYLNYLGGDWPEAMELARRTLLEGTDPARPMHNMMMGGAIRILGGQGWLARARALAADGRGMPMSHVIDHAEFTVLRKLGDDENADELLFAAARSADQAGYLLGTEDLWADLTRSALLRKNQREAEHWVDRSARTAMRLDTARAHLCHHLARAAAYRDKAAARRAVAIARERRDVPYETAMAFLWAGLAGYDTERLLNEAYELYGEVGAWFWRARLRKVLRDLGFAGPGRAEAAAENERLLAILVAEGLSNRQLAVVLDTSEKSVEGRLSRMFARIGYGSRVELAAAILTGEYVF